MHEPFADPAWIENHDRFAQSLAHLARSIIQFKQTRKSAMTSSLLNKSVVVIGGSSGIGAAVALRARMAGARAIIVSRSGRSPGGVEAVAADSTDPALLDAAFAKIGVIDHLVHTAGARTASAPIQTLDSTVLEATFATKLFGSIHAVRQALPHLAEQGSVTLTSGQVSRKFGTGTFVKGSVNAAVDALGRHLAKELAPRRVNVVSPGIVDTDLWGAPGSQSREATMARALTLPVGRGGTPDELADAYLFAMTNSFLTGTVIDIDGGGLL